MHFEVLNEENLQRIHDASMAILGRTGVAVYERQSLKQLEDGGADVDFGKSRARLPERLITNSIENAPSRFMLAARDHRRSVELGSGSTHFTNSATGIKVLDHETGRVRQSVLADICQFARVADALENIAFYGPTVVAHDAEGKLHFLKETVAAIENTTKHVAHECQGTEMTKHFIRIAHTIAGGEDAFRKSPVVSMGGCPVSPLQFDKANTEAMVESARAGMPYDVLSMAMGGGTAPVTLAGELALINAEVLAGIAICQLFAPGCPVIYGSVASVMDMRTGILALGAPERALINVAAVQLAHHYQIPCLVGGISTDAKLPGDQAMYEKTMTGLPPVLAGSDIVFGPAVLSSATTYSVEQLVIDDEVAGALLRIKRGIDVDDESLALNLVDKIGPGGGFIGTRHTLEHTKKDIWRPVLSDRNIYDNWLKLGAKDMRARAKERVAVILKEHDVPPLEREQKRDIDKILQDAKNGREK
ncbi:MAG: trimethylamine methyltransferase family protein [Thermoplasmatota archaeon]